MCCKTNNIKKPVQKPNVCRGRSKSHQWHQRSNNHHEFSELKAEEQSDSEEYSLTYHSIIVSDKCMVTVDKMSRDNAFTTLKIQAPNIPGTHNLKLKIDTGASGNTLPIWMYRQMYGEKPFSEFLEPLQHVTLSAYNGEHIKCVGTIKLKCQFNNSQFHELSWMCQVQQL